MHSGVARTDACSSSDMPEGGACCERSVVAPGTAVPDSGSAARVEFGCAGPAGMSGAPQSSIIAKVGDFFEEDILSG